MSDVKSSTPDDHIKEAQTHLTNAQNMKDEGKPIRIRALNKAKESVQRAIDKIANP